MPLPVTNDATDDDGSCDFADAGYDATVFA